MNLKKIIFIILLSVPVLCFAEPEFVYDTHGRRDPFLPLVSKEGYIINREADVSTSDMNLEGIIYDKRDKSLAIINGKVLKVGEKIGNYTIAKIEKQSITLQNNSEEFNLELKKQEE